MRVLLVGAGGVGGSIALIAARRSFFEAMIVADYDGDRAAAVVASTGDPRFVAARVDAADCAQVQALIAEHRCDALVNATDPRFVMPLFRAALAAGVDYLDMAMSLSRPHPTEPYRKTGVMLGDEQFALHDEFAEAGKQDRRRRRDQRHQDRDEDGGGHGVPPVPPVIRCVFSRSVMLVLVTSIHVLNTALAAGRRGWSGQARP